MKKKGILVVDLDGTLVKTDMLFETFWSVLSSDLWAAFNAIRYIFSGRASLKQRGRIRSRQYSDYGLRSI